MIADNVKVKVIWPKDLSYFHATVARILVDWFGEEMLRTANEGDAERTNWRRRVRTGANRLGQIRTGRIQVKNPDHPCPGILLPSLLRQRRLAGLP